MRTSLKLTEWSGVFDSRKESAFLSLSLSLTHTRARTHTISAPVDRLSVAEIGSSLKMAMLPASSAILGAMLLLASVGSRVKAEMANSEIAKILHRPIRAVSYPPVSNMGLVMALAVPLEEPANTVAISYFFEANYALPDNSSIYGELGPIVAKSRRKRSIDRSTFYAVIENKFESAGFPGRPCLLRSICEASEHPLELHNGLLGDIFRIIFTPSSSKPEDQLPDGVISAELKGRNGTCSDYQSLCSLGLFDLIGYLL